MENAAVEVAQLTDNPIAVATEDAGAGQAPRAAARRHWGWVVFFCILMAASGGFRQWRDWQFHSLSLQSSNCPFPLKSLPKGLGPWRGVEGTEATLDPEVARIAGSSDHFIRVYSNEGSPAPANVLVLYGLADLVWGHIPDICYPAAGYRKVRASQDLEISTSDPGKKAVFRREVYAKLKGGLIEQEEVYYSFLNAGNWKPDMMADWKKFRYNPGMFKIQVQRSVRGRADGGADETMATLLSNLVKEIEGHVARAEGLPKPPAGQAEASQDSSRNS